MYGVKRKVGTGYSFNKLVIPTQFPLAIRYLFTTVQLYLLIVTKMLHLRPPTCREIYVHNILAIKISLHVSYRIEGFILRPQHKIK